jgi:DNA polymerase III delta subunit
VRSAFLRAEIREDTLLPGYFFHGEETFHARQFLRDLRSALISPDVQGLSLERFDLATTPWRDILDGARTMPFFFSPWRILLVEIDDSEYEDLTRTEEKILKEYFAAPTSRTILLVVFAGKIRKTGALYKTLTSLPKASVLVKEMKILKGPDLFGWVEEKATTLEKRVSSEAVDRLLELAGSDLQRLDNEVEKLATFIGDKAMIELADVDQLLTGVKDFEGWALSDRLEKADLEGCLTILHSLFTEGARPEQVVGIISGYFKSVLLAKAYLRESRPRLDIFQEFKPKVKTSWSNYQKIFRDFFAPVDGLSWTTLNRLIAGLQNVDLQIKTTDASKTTLLESFVADYCRLRKAGRITSPGRG